MYTGCDPYKDSYLVVFTRQYATPNPTGRYSRSSIWYFGINQQWAVAPLQRK